MPNGPSGQKRPADTNRLAASIVAIATGETEDKGTVPYRAKAGQTGGRNRADKLSPERRKAISAAAAKARWRDKS